MKIFTIGFLIGVGAAGLVLSPISPFWGLGMVLASLILYRRWPWRGLLLVVGTFAGVAWMAWHVDLELHQQLPMAMFQRPVLVTGTVASLPQYKWGSVSFQLNTYSIDGQSTRRLIKLRWQQKGAFDQFVQLGDARQFVVKLKPANQYQHYHGFNYARWLFLHHIIATAIVLRSDKNQLLRHNPWYHPVDQVRYYLFVHIHQSLIGEPLADLLVALTIGDRSEMTNAQWQVLQRTGTAHLMAIAGLHIGLVAGVMFFIVNLCWRLSTRLMLIVPAVSAAGVAAWIAAFIYSALAGFSLPTQRAMIMLTCFSVALLCRRVLAPWQAYFTALLLVLLFEPFQVLTVSFWMSFVVVGLIVYWLSGKQKKHYVMDLIRLQFVVALAVTPLTLYFFHQAAWLSPFLNAVAIPWVGFIVIPLSLLGCLCVTCLPSVSHALWWLALENLQVVWRFLSFFSNLHWSAWQHQISFWQFIGLLGVVIVLLSPLLS